MSEFWPTGISYWWVISRLKKSQKMYKLLLMCYEGENMHSQGTFSTGYKHAYKVAEHIRISVYRDHLLMGYEGETMHFLGKFSTGCNIWNYFNFVSVYQLWFEKKLCSYEYCFLFSSVKVKALRNRLSFKKLQTVTDSCLGARAYTYNCLFQSIFHKEKH